MVMKRYGAAGLLLLLLAGISAAAQSDAPLADAVEKKDRAKAAALLKKGADVNAPQADGMTALHWAVYHDDLSTAALLVKAGANAKAGNRSMVCYTQKDGAWDSLPFFSGRIIVQDGVRNLILICRNPSNGEVDFRGITDFVSR